MSSREKLQAQTRSLEQDSTLNNLAHTPGYEPAEFGTLGSIIKIGSGAHTLIFLPGFGFGADSYQEFLETYVDQYTIYAVTLPGFGNTKALPLEEASDFHQTLWIDSAVSALQKLIEQENLEDVLLISHWIVGDQIAMKFSFNHPEQLKGVILISGSAKAYYDSIPGMKDWTHEQQIIYSNLMAERWFKTVTRTTWDDNNFMDYDYVVNPLRGLFLWRVAARPNLSVMIHYLLEYYATDLTAEFSALDVPLLVIQPGFDDPDFFIDQNRNYMKNLCLDSWQGVEHKLIQFQKISNSRLFVMYDQPDELNQVVRQFVHELDQR